MKAKFGTILAGILWVIAIALSIFAIFKIIPYFELSIGFLTISFGILAIIWTSIAVKNLSPGSSLRSYTLYFLFSLIFIMLFSILHTLEMVFQWTGFVVIIKYICITITYLIFVYASYSMWKIGREFGFRDEAKKIKKRIELKNKKRKNINFVL